MKVDNLNKNALTNTFTQTLSRCERCFFSLKEQEVCQTIKSLELFETDAANDCVKKCYDTGRRKDRFL